MNPTSRTLACDRIFSVADYVSEELAARGWSFAFAAARVSGDLDLNILWLQMVSCRPLWWANEIVLSQDEAERLARIFGTSSELFMNIYRHFAQGRSMTSEKERDAIVRAMLKGEL